MSKQTTNTILALLPLADRLIFDLGGKLLEINTKTITRAELLAALDASRSDTWPELQFVSSARPEVPAA